jgi:hypothetical protein
LWPNRSAPYVQGKLPCNAPCDSIQGRPFQLENSAARRDAFLSCCPGIELNEGRGGDPGACPQRGLPLLLAKSIWGGTVGTSRRACARATKRSPPRQQLAGACARMRAGVHACVRV